MILTLEIPEELAARMESIPANQRNNYAITALAYGLDNMPLQEEGEPDPEAVAAIRRAVEMGLDKSVPLEDFARSMGIKLK